MSAYKSSADVIAKCQAEGRAALIGYLPAGYPDIETSRHAFEILAEEGCDLLEIGVPYSDPVMDGPVIESAAVAALHAGFRLKDLFPLIEGLSEKDIPALVMTYWNPVFRYGVDRFATDLESAGGLGLITPNLIPEEAEAWFQASDRLNLDRVFLVAPSSTPERLILTTNSCRGFVYAASTMGVTGARTDVSMDAAELVARVRKASGIAVGVGIGVSNGEAARYVAGYADAVIVGSALVAALNKGEDALRALVRELAAGVRGETV
ncbi:MAG: tryptophan synthase subunit alpha [Segniliparus sp.]|uniref:tryptophan synthase subunit alpha n=1 Tax=Segniliparus sp. TaxID=2804064 RepID=UPI003F31175C